MLPWSYPNPNPYHFTSQEAFNGGVPQQQEPPNPGFILPPPSLDPFHMIFGHQLSSETLEAVLRPPPPPPAHPAVAPPEAAMSADHAMPGSGGGGRAAARRRPFRTDRHSKIRTAQGVRDRRMRLSLDVAREFFALQDRLGFDKASQTVDWLMTQSKPAIERLCGTLQPSDIVSIYSSMSKESAGAAAARRERGEQSSVGARDAREKARARARERTIEKLRRRADGSPPELPAPAASSDQPMDGDGGAAMDGLYYYFSEMLDDIAGEDEDADADADEEEGDEFFDGMQYC